MAAVAAAGSPGTTLGVASPRTGGAVAAGRCPDELYPENGTEYIGGRAGGGRIIVPDENVFVLVVRLRYVGQMKVSRAKNGLRNIIRDET